MIQVRVLDLYKSQCSSRSTAYADLEGSDSLLNLFYFILLLSFLALHLDIIVGKKIFFLPRKIYSSGTLLRNFMEYEKGIYTYLCIYRSLLELYYVKLERLIVKDVNPH